MGEKIRGKIHYFGAWDDPSEAEPKYLEIREYLQAGRRPPDTRDGCRVREMCNHFLTSKKALLDSDEIAPVTFQDYERTCTLVVDHFGRETLVEDLNASDFDVFRNRLAKTRKIVALGMRSIGQEASSNMHMIPT